MAYVKKTHRFGLLTPSSNTTQEPEFTAALPPSVSLHTGRVAYRDITPEEQDRCVFELESESRKLAPQSTASCSPRPRRRSPRARATTAS
jgi:maleate cis-trans isomerase